MSFPTGHYIGRINRVMDYVENNLDKDLSLHVLAKKAFFSPFHFHRIFSALNEETINEFVIRKRLERIASILLKDKNIPLTDLAYKYGFKSSSSFSRAFKKFFEISPTDFKEIPSNNFSKICQVESKIGKKNLISQKYICSINNLKKWIAMNAKIEIKQMPTLNLAYISHIGDLKQVSNAFDKLIKWATPKGLLNEDDVVMATVYHDDPKITDESKIRQSASLLLKDEITPNGEVGFMKIPEGKFAVGNFEIFQSEFEMAWNSMFLWVEENGYTTRDKDYYELYFNDYKKHPEGKFIVEICVPVN